MTPMAAFVKSFYEEFYLSKLKTDVKMEQRIDAMINKSKPKAAAEPEPQRQVT